MESKTELVQGEGSNMKKIVCLLFGITIVLLTACGAPPAAGNDGSGGYAEPADPSIDLAANSSEIFMPNGKGNAPDGILDQLAWIGGGGSGILNPCGNCLADVNGNNLYLTGFDPYQNLLLIFYRRIGELNACGLGISEFVKTAQVQVDGNGTLNLLLNGSVDRVFVETVIDADTEKVEMAGSITGSSQLYTECSVTTSSCSGAPAQRVQTGGSAYVCTQQDRLIVRSQPSSSTNEIIRFEPGTQFNITGGPECSGNMFWWKIEVNGTTGWVAEGGDSVDPYYICPVQ